MNTTLKTGDLCRVEAGVHFYHFGLTEWGFYRNAEHNDIEEIAVFLRMDEENALMGYMTVLLTRYGIRLIQKSFVRPIDQPFLRQ